MSNIEDQLDSGLDVQSHQAQFTAAVVAGLEGASGCSVVWYKPESTV